MPIYSFECIEHGVIDLLQNMTDSHEAVCEVCRKPMHRIFHAPQLKCQDSKVGKTRSELFDNLALEGHGSVNWRDYDPVYKKENGIID